MTATQLSSVETAFSSEILALQKAVERDPKDLVARISLGSALEQDGFLNEALACYQTLRELDRDNLFVTTVDKAIADIQLKLGKTAPAINSAILGEAIADGGEMKVVLPLNNDGNTYPEEIRTLQEAAAQDPNDLIAKIVLASALEQGGYFSEAIAVYREAKRLDHDGSFGSTIEKALTDLEAKVNEQIVETVPQRGFLSYRQGLGVTDENIAQQMAGTGQFGQRLSNLPIAYKQFIAFLTCSAISVVGVVGAGMAISVLAGRDQLKNQANAELAITDTNYGIKINQMGFGFRGQSDNPAIINAAQMRSKGEALPPELQQQLRKILVNETKTRKIEYATLVGKDLKIIASANADRRGQTFNPDGLVQKVLKDPQQIKTSAIVTLEELKKENPPLLKSFKDEDALIRYTFTPVQNPQTRQVIGVLVSGDVVNGKDAIVRATMDAFGGGYSAVYFRDRNGKFHLATSLFSKPNTARTNEPQLIADVPISNLAILEEVAQQLGKGNFSARTKIEKKEMTLAAKTIPDSNGKPIAFLLRGTPEDDLNTLLTETFLLQLTVGIFALVFSGLVAIIFGRALTKPLKELQETAQKLGMGETGVRAEVQSEDEVGQLAATINEMAERIETSTRTIEATSQQREQEALSQRQQKEALQEGVISLLISIEEAARGDLTVKSRVEMGAVGSIADAFNSTLTGLRRLVEQVMNTAKEVNTKAQDNSQSVSELSAKAIAQTQEIEIVSRSVSEMANDLEAIDRTTQSAAMIARTGNEAAQDGQVKMEQTVNSIYKIRGRIADISKKSKRLAESSLEISKIVSIISGISEKTNLLAFNASIEAARAGENGQGFRIVADEVRRLAEMVTVSAQEIEQVVLRIQEETAQMNQMMEESTSEVVTGTQLIQNTKETLQNLAQISQEIDGLLATISSSTESQRLTSEAVTQTMQNIAEVSKSTSDRSLSVSESLQELAQSAISLEHSASQFKVE